MSLADQSLQWYPTSVQVTVFQARSLRIKGKNGTNDTYAIMQVAKDKFATSVVEKTVSPIWKEEATFDLPLFHHGNTERCTLHVHVMHRALLGPDKLLGQAVINLLELNEIKSRNKTEWFKLVDKAGKADKERGEVLLDIQFMRNNMTASMFDLSASDKSRSRLGKFKDKVRGKKKEGLSDSASAVVPSFTQVLTDSEGEGEAEGNGDGATDKEEKKKKNKVKSLFSPKSNLQRNMSQSMSVLGPLPERNSPLSGSRSSGLSVDSSEGKKKFKFLTHKRTGSSDSKSSQGSVSLLGRSKQSPAPTADQSNLCINGSHVYTEEVQPRSARAGSTFSLASSGHGSMEDLRRSQGRKSSIDSLKAVKQPSLWEEETSRADLEQEEKVQVEQERKSVEERQNKKLEKEKERREMEEDVKQKRREEEEKRMRDLEEEERRRGLEEEERIRSVEQERGRLEEEQRIEEERRKFEEAERTRREKQAEEIRIEDQERQRIKEENSRIEEEERIRKEEERIRKEEERIRKEEQERRRVEEDGELVRLEEEKRAVEEKNKRLEEERRVRQEYQEEEKRKILEQERLYEEERKKEEEELLKRQTEEEQLKQEDRLREEMEGKKEEEQRIRREEEEKMRKEEEENAIRREEEERKKRDIEEKIKSEEDKLRKAAEDRKRKEEEEQLRKEKEENRLRREEEEERVRKKEEENRLRREEEEERVRKEKEENRLRREEEEERVRKKEEENRLRREEEEERVRKKEEENRLRREEEEEQVRKKEEEYRREEEERKIRDMEEKLRIEEERRRTEEEERVKREVEDRVRVEEEERKTRERERLDREMEDKRREERETTIRLEKERVQREERIRSEEKSRKEQEEKSRVEEQKRTLMEEQERVSMDKERRQEEILCEKERRMKEEEEEKRSLEAEKIGLAEIDKRTDRQETEGKALVGKERLEDDRFEDSSSPNHFDDTSASTASSTEPLSRTARASSVRPSSTSCAIPSQPLVSPSLSLAPSEPEGSENPPAANDGTNTSQDSLTNLMEKKRRAPLPPNNMCMGNPNLATTSPAQVKPTKLTLTTHSAVPFEGKKEDNLSKGRVCLNGQDRSSALQDQRPTPQAPGSLKGMTGDQKQTQKEPSRTTKILGNCNKPGNKRETSDSGDFSQHVQQVIAPLNASSTATAGTAAENRGSQGCSHHGNQNIDYTDIPSVSGYQVAKHNKGPAPSRPMFSSLSDKTVTKDYDGNNIGNPTSVQKHSLASVKEHKMPQKEDYQTTETPVVSELNPFVGSGIENQNIELCDNQESLHSHNQSSFSTNEDVTLSKSLKTFRAPKPPVKISEAAGNRNMDNPPSRGPLTSGSDVKKQANSMDVEQPVDTIPQAPCVSPSLTSNSSSCSESLKGSFDRKAGPLQPVSGQVPLLQVRSQPCETRSLEAYSCGGEEAEGKADKRASTSRRPHPVKPFGSLEPHSAPSIQSEQLDKSAVIPGNFQVKTKLQKSGMKGLYSQLTQEELISLVVKQQKQLVDRDKKIAELEKYIDNLLVRVIEEAPCILMSLNSPLK